MFISLRTTLYFKTMHLFIYFLQTFSKYCVQVCAVVSIDSENCEISLEMLSYENSGVVTTLVRTCACVHSVCVYQEVGVW